MTDLAVLLTIDANSNVVDAAHELSAVLDNHGIKNHLDPAETTERTALKASHAMVALQAYAAHLPGEEGEPIESVVSDLLADLMHLCDLFLDDDEGIDFDFLLERAHMNHAAEVAGE